MAEPKTSTVSKVRLPIDDVVDEVYARCVSETWSSARVLDILAGQTEYVVRGVLEKHRVYTLVKQDGA